jgi:hypothetical protein
LASTGLKRKLNKKKRAGRAESELSPINWLRSIRIRKRSVSVPKPVLGNKLLRFALGLLAMLALSACASIGAGSMKRDCLDYTEALAKAWKEQTLLNVVKLRYADTPVFLEVTSVISSYQLQSQVSLLGSLSYNLSPGIPNEVGRGATVGATGTYIDKPTVTYTPLQGDKFTRELLRPIPPAAIFQLIQAGYAVDPFFQLTVRAINGIYNRSSRGSGTRDADPEFYQLLDALRRLQLSEAIDFRLEKRGWEETSIISFRSSRFTPAVEQDLLFVRKVLGLSQKPGELHLTFGAVPRKDTELAVLTRSMLEILIELSARIEVPETDVQAGKAFPVPPPRPESGSRDQPMVKIHSGAKPPADAFVAVNYSDHWFWIDNSDYRSKAVFSFLMLLTSLAQTGVAPQAPVITVPAS